MSSIFGGSKQKSTSSNQAYGTLSNALSPVVNTVGSGVNALLGLLGLGGDSSSAAQGLEGYKNSAGYQNAIEGGSRAITGNKAAAGLLRSGSTGKALTQFGEETAQKYYNDYIQNIINTAGLGLNAGSVLASAGNQSKSTSKSKNGLGGFIGQLASGSAASDPRLKKNIRKIGSLQNGLGVYQYNYINGKGPYIGVMADEVSRIQPEALGPEVAGYMTVNYDKIKGLKEYGS